MSRKLTFGEWEKDIAQKIIAVQNATNTICGVICTTPLRQTAEEKLVAIDGLNALERQLRGELNRGRRKHIKRQKTMCQSCGEQRASWSTEDGKYLCTECACSRCHIDASVPRCECCGRLLHGVTVGYENNDNTQLYCSPKCALKGRGCEQMTEETNDED